MGRTPLVGTAIVDALRTGTPPASGHSTGPTVGAFVEADGVGSLVDLNGSVPMQPNSTQKLVTAAATLLTLPLGSRFCTEVWAEGRLASDGVLAGDLVLVASGDPILSGSELARLGPAIADAGIRRVLGRLAVDDTRYDHLRSVPGWRPYYMPAFVGPLSALVVDRNRWRRDRSFLADPVPANAGRLMEALARAGVTIRGPAVRRARTPGAHLIAAHQSRPVEDIVRHMLLGSDSFVAELLLKEIGAGVGEGGTSGGLGVVECVAARLRVARRASKWADGSGLSPLNLDTPKGQVAWLRAVEQTPIAERLRHSLPVAAREGTLRNRLHGTPAAGRVFAKSGTRRRDGTANLAGYASSTSHGRLRFSFVVSGASSIPAAIAAIDRAVVAMLGTT